MNFGKMLGEDLEGLGDFAIKPQIMSDELVDLDDQPPSGVSGMGAIYPQTYYGYGYNSGQLLSAQPYGQQYYSSIYSPYRYGTRNWWQWYATVYLPQYYNQQQAYQLIIQNPLYTTYGFPQGYAYSPYVSSYPQSYPYTYGSSYGYGYGTPYYGYPQYQLYQQSAAGAAACQQQGGYYDYAQQACYPSGAGYGGQTGTPPNVIGQTVQQGVSTLNASGFTVWERLNNGVNQGNPPPTSATNRVVIDDENGIITAAYVG